MSAGYQPAAVANEFLERSGRDEKPLTPMQLLKLVYIAHGWYLAVKGKPLLNEKVEAWKYGPVVPSLFQEFKEFGGGPIKRLAFVAAEPTDLDFCDTDPEPELVVSRPFLPKADTDAIQLVDWVWRTYGSMSAWQLSRMTHEPNTPWSDAVEQMKRRTGGLWEQHVEIDNEAIRRHYVDLWNKQHAAV